MTDTKATKGDSFPSDPLRRLVASNALTQLQAEFIESLGDDFNADSFAHPYLQTVREDTRVYLTGRTQEWSDEQLLWLGRS